MTGVVYLRSCRGWYRYLSLRHLAGPAATSLPLRLRIVQTCGPNSTVSGGAGCRVWVIHTVATTATTRTTTKAEPAITVTVRPGLHQLSTRNMAPLPVSPTA